MISKVTRHRLWGFAGLLIAGVVLFVAARHYLSFDVLIAHEAWLRAEITATPVRASAIALAVFTALSLIPGLAGKSVVFGWLLGFFKGLLVVNVGLTVAALVAFLISRFVIRETVEWHLGWFLRRIKRKTRDDHGSVLLSLRLLHLPFTVVNYGLGATDVPLRRFWWTTQLGLLPGNIAFVLAGAGLPSLKVRQEPGSWSLVKVPLRIGLTMAGFLPVVIRWAVRRNASSVRHKTCT